jgi:hypothetical protein
LALAGWLIFLGVVSAIVSFGQTLFPIAFVFVPLVSEEELINPNENLTSPVEFGRFVDLATLRAIR